ncbi:hypothetical protein OL548_19580 [Lysinibacillus sp. MHQ-1]|nr:hypothetical protein OL548_19580 [Lysinibacillus sp. MHQ-1]
MAEGVGMPPNELTLTAQQSAYQNDLVQQAFAEICSIKIPEDGVQFFENDIESIIVDTSIHLKIPATLGSITTYIEVKNNLYRKSSRTTDHYFPISARHEASGALYISN